LGVGGTKSVFAISRELDLFILVLIPVLILVLIFFLISVILKVGAFLTV
jgi:hypothetical protein